MTNLDLETVKDIQNHLGNGAIVIVITDGWNTGNTTLLTKNLID